LLEVISASSAGFAVCGTPVICLALNVAPCKQTCFVAVNGGVRLQRKNEHKRAYRIK